MTPFSISTKAGSSMQYSFAGSAVAIYGPVDPNGAPYAVQFDGEIPQNFSVLPSRYVPQSLLYYRGGIGKGMHTVRVTHEGDGADGKVLAIDYINVFTAPSLDPTYVVSIITLVEDLTDVASRTRDRLPPTTIAAIAVGTITFLILFLITMFYYVRRNPGRDQTQSRLAKFFSFNWWKYGDNDTLEGAKRVTKRKQTGKERFELDGSGRYAVVGTSDRDTEYLIPDYGPPGVGGSSTGRTAKKEVAGGGDEREEVLVTGRPSVHFSTFSNASRTMSQSTGTSGQHSKQQASLSGLSVLNQPLMRPGSATDFGVGGIGSSGTTQRQSQLSPPPDASLAPQTVPSTTPAASTITSVSNLCCLLAKTHFYSHLHSFLHCRRQNHRVQAPLLVQITNEVTRNRVLPQ